MQDGRLSIAQILRQGTGPHGRSAEVVTWTDGRPRRRDYATVGRRAAQLAHALRELGVTGDQRVGTFMWNNAEHLEAYFAVPAMGAVLHTLNIRLFPDQISYIADHAEDHVVVVDGSLLPLFQKILPTLSTVRHVIVANGDAKALQAPDGVQVHDYEELLRGKPDVFDWPDVDERSAAAMCYTSGTTGNPKGVVYSHRSIWLHSMQVCMSDGMALAQSDRGLAVVPMFHAMSWGLPYAALMVGASLVMPDRFLQPEPDRHQRRPHHQQHRAGRDRAQQVPLRRLPADDPAPGEDRQAGRGGDQQPLPRRGPPLQPAVHHRTGQQHRQQLHRKHQPTRDQVGDVHRPRVAPDLPAQPDRHRGRDDHDPGRAGEHREAHPLRGGRRLGGAQHRDQQQRRRRGAHEPSFSLHSRFLLYLNRFAPCQFPRNRPGVLPVYFRKTRMKVLTFS